MEEVIKPGKVWTMQAYILHNEAMRESKSRFDEERDRRYAEVNIEKEKALRIKETADLAALNLAREGQQYKDIQADKMRDKNLEASGIYVTNADLQTVMSQLSTNQSNFADKMENALKPLVEYVNGQQGATSGNQITWGKIFSSIGVAGIIVGLLLHFVK